MRGCCLALSLSSLLIAGCMDSLQEQVEADSPKSIVGKSTQTVGEFDPNKKDQEISKSEVHYSNPVTGPLEAKVPIEEQLSKLNIEYSVRLFHAEHGRYPKDYEEFMEKIIREGGIRLPLLPANREYQYDVENHKLVVVVHSQQPKADQP
jgi:hypothetical protein